MVNSSTVPSSRADFPVREVLACKAAKDLDLRLVPTSLETPDALGAIAFGEEYWDDAARAASVPTSSDPRIPALLERILASLRQKWVAPAGKPGNDFALLRNAIGWAGRDADSFAAARVVAIREWLEASVIYDDRIPAPKDAVAVDDFLHGDLKGSDSHLARAAVLLLQAAGIPSRVAEGYLVPLEPQRPYQFTVMDVHGTEWAEIHVRGMGWMPLVIRPRQVISREPPPPAKTKQDDVLGKVNTPPPAAGTGTRARLMWFAVAALEAAATVVAGLIFVYMGRGLWVYRRRFVTGADEALIKHRPYLHRWLLAAAAELLGLAGFERRAYGVTWAEFAEGFEKFANSEGHKSRPLAKAFSDLVRFNALGEDGLLDEAAIAELIACYAGFRSALPATRFIKVIGQLKSFTTPTKPL